VRAHSRHTPKTAVKSLPGHHNARPHDLLREAAFLRRDLRCLVLALED